MLKIAIAGCLGRMGATLVKSVREDARFTLAAGSERPGFDTHQLAALGGGFFVSDNPEEVAKRAEAVIDFTTPEATLAMAAAVATQGGIHIIGTTGFSPAQLKELEAHGKKARIVRAGNFSLAVAVLSHLVEKTARLLDDAYDIEIFEMHHRHKKDAPSGTALMLGEAAAKGRGISFADKKKLERSGERKKGDIGFSVARGGDVVGIHTVIFSGGDEMLELKHQGFSREIYAKGALRAALWAKDQKPGCYGIHDVLNLSD